MKEFRAEDFLTVYDYINKDNAVFIEGLNRCEKHREYCDLQETEMSKARSNIKIRSRIKRHYDRLKHELFVDKCLDPKGYLNDRNEVFALLLPPDSCSIEGSWNDTYTEYHVSLLTPVMAYTDYMYLMKPEESRSKWWHEEYRPYYYDLGLCINEVEDSQWQEFYNKNCEGVWLCAKLFKGKDHTGEGICRTGVLRFGGSESFTDDVTIEFVPSKKQLGKLNNSNCLNQLWTMYNDELRQIQPEDVTSFFNRTLIPTTNGYKANVLNVGQANCIHFEGDNGLSFMFDIGVPLEEYTDPSPNGARIVNDDYKTGSNTIKNIGILARYKPDFIIISHWHYDHFAGFIYMSDAAINSHWIVPALEGLVNDITCVRIALYLAQKQKLSVVYDNYSSILYSSGIKRDIELFRGEKVKNPSGNLDLNAGSLILRVRDTVFSADCMYKNWPDELVNRMNIINKLVVPHHAGYISDDDKNALKKLKGRKRAAVVCCGYNGYKHPKDFHIRELIDNDLDRIYITGGDKMIKYYGVDASSFSAIKAVNTDIIINCK